MKHVVLTAFCIIALSISQQSYAAGKQYELYSPDRHVKVTVTVNGDVTYQVSVDGKALLKPSPISMTFENGDVLGMNASVSKRSTRSVNTTVKPLYGFNDNVNDHFNELTLRFKKPFSIVFRVYNNGVAYRIETRMQGNVKVKHEQVAYNFPKDEKAWYLDPKSPRWHGYESTYSYGYISKIDSIKVPLPMLIDHSSGIKVLLTEADLHDYPGLYLEPGHGEYYGMKGIMPAYPSKEKQNRLDINVLERTDYIAQTEGTRTFPWRLMILARQDKDLLNNELVYLLATPNKLQDTSWIKPGLVSWDWWNDWNLEGVDFKTGINMDTYKYYIDFASKNGIPYIILDEGWSNDFDLFDVNKNLDIAKLAEYGKEKNVGLILWCVWHTLDSQRDKALAQFEKWGIAGVKVDFMDRDDQKVVDFYTRLAKAAAEHHLMVDFHGAFKPTGLSRTYPNIINREGVFGMENDKWTDAEDPFHEVILAFTRMVAGAMDYTPGAMRNYNKNDFRPLHSRPESQGTRCHQLAMYVDYYAPLQMLSDAPTAYQKEPVIMNLLSGMPTTWDQTVALDGKVGDYLMIARRKGDTWYIGGMTNWTPRDLSVDLSFLGSGNYNADIYSDAINSNRIGSDYNRNNQRVTSSTKLKIHMAPGGGWVAVIKPAQ